MYIYIYKRFVRLKVVTETSLVASRYVSISVSAST